MIFNPLRQQKFFWVVIFLAVLFNTAQVFSTPANKNFSNLVINEFMAANQSSLADEDGDYSDWIEIYNPSSQAVNLSGWALTDDPIQPEKWTFPNISLESRAYLLVFASGKDRKSSEPGLALHTNFRLDQASEFLGLYNTFDDRFVDLVASPLPTEQKEGVDQRYPEQFKDVSYGRYGHQSGSSANGLTFGYFAAPTPGQPNDEAVLWTGLVAPVSFSQERGFYEAPLTVELATTTPGAVIRYTLDGSEPAEAHGDIFSGPITISKTTLLRAAAFKQGLRASPVETHTYIFLDDILSQPKNPPGFPKSWGGYHGAPVIADYEMDPDIVDDPRYHEAVEEALTSIPTLSIVTDMRSFHDLYANPKRKGRAWERPVSVELIDPHQNQVGFQIDAGLRMHGELGRSEYIPKHPFRLLFRSEYGTGKLEYPLFPGSPVEEFDTLVLRSGVNRSYAGYPGREEDIKLTTYTRDEWLRASQRAMSGSGPYGVFVHLYLNGLYWGLYNIVERPDAAFMASYFGGAEENWQTISHQETTSHSSERFKALHDLASEGDLEAPEKYAAVKTYLDIPHFIDYLILNWYSGNLDWGFNNWYVGVQNPAGQIRYFAWDGERTWYEGAEIYMELDEYLERPNLVRPLFEALLENPDFRIELADRMYKHLFNNGVLADANSQARWMDLNQIIEQAIIAESARWGDTRFETPLTPEDWVKARDDVLAQMEGNADRLIRLARKAGYYPDIDPPMFSQQGGHVTAGFELSLHAPSEDGTIYYTTDGSDPRLQGTGGIAPMAQVYEGPLVLTTTTPIKARILANHSLTSAQVETFTATDTGQIWSPLNEALFVVEDQTSSRLSITEIMYNPTGGDDYEFIELKNMGNVDLNLAGMSFTGITFTFPPLTTPLSPGGIIVLVKTPTAFSHRYPEVMIGGVYEGQLSNKGEKITIKDAEGNTIISFEYDDEHGWPVSADGQGDSLILTDLALDPNEPAHWRASPTLNGSPGVDER
jgi:hypothetical protein